MKYQIFFALTGLLFFAQSSYAQSGDIDLANEYFNKGELVKAREYYEKVIRSPDDVDKVYDNYLQTMYGLDAHEDLDRFFKKLVKKEPEDLRYQIDWAHLDQNRGKETDAEKAFQKIATAARANSTLTKRATAHMEKRGLFNWAIYTYEEVRKSGDNKYAYANELAVLHLRNGNTSAMLDEYLLMLFEEEQYLEYVQNRAQNYLTEKSDFELLEKKLYAQLQQHPTKIVFNKMLVWIYLQRMDFFSAYMQAKAIDKRQGEKTRKGIALMEVGQIALKNKDYENATLAFEYISENFEGSVYHSSAQRLLIQAKEELVKTTYPINEEEIKKLIADYNALVENVRNADEIVKIQRAKARLYAFYLHDIDKASETLSQAVRELRVTPSLKTEAKIDLADIYLLDGQYGEASLLYKQAEREQKDTRIGHTAKLKDAKLSYYQGNFELAQAFLDVLKLATSREISNDAIDLSLMITDNTGLDTSTLAMEKYAYAELLVFQHKIEEAFAALDAHEKMFPNHSLTDEIYWLRSNIYRNIGQIDSSIIYLEKIINNYPTDILGDNAYYSLGLIYEEDKRDKAKAMDYYKEILLTYPGSIYAADARKRYRQLRGDKIN